MKRSILILIIFFAIPGISLADGETPQEKALLSLLDKGRAKAKQLIEKSERKNSSDPASTETNNTLAGQTKQLGASPRLPGDEDVISRLSRQVNSLRQKDIVARAQAASTEKPKDVKRVGTKTVFYYKEGGIYEIHTGVDRITDVELQPGESLTSPPVSGDTVRWKVNVIQSGKGSKQQMHVILKPLESDIETNFILTTDKHIYHLKVVAGDWYIPSVSWNYPQEESADFQALKIKEQSQEPLQVSPEKLHFNYEIDGSSYSWKPLRVFDDGEKTYIQMPSELQIGEAPVLFAIEEDESNPILVNYRVKGNYYIVDRLIEKAELRVGTSKKISIEKGEKPSFFARLFSL